MCVYEDDRPSLNVDSVSVEAYKLDAVRNFTEVVSRTVRIIS